MGLINALSKLYNGLVANDGTGDSLRVGAGTINANSDIIVAAVNSLAASQGSGLKPFATKAQLIAAQATLPAGTVAVVFADATPSNNTSYVWDGTTLTTAYDRLTFALGNGSGFVASGIGSILRSINDKLSESVSVLDKGADPSGSSDSTVAFQNAINSAYGKTLRIPGGTYIVGALTINNTIKVVGDGVYNSILKPASSLSSATYLLNVMLDSGTSASSKNIFGQLTNVHLEGFSVVHDYSFACNAIQFAGLDQLKVHDVEVDSVNGTGIYLSNAASVRESDLHRVSVWRSGNATSPAFYINSPPHGGSTGQNDCHNEIRFYSCKAIFCKGSHLTIDCTTSVAGGGTADGARFLNFYGCQWEASPTTGVGDVVSIKRADRNINFFGGSMGQPNGYQAGVQAGYAICRIGNAAAGYTVGEVNFIGGVIGGYTVSGGNNGGVGLVAESFGLLKMTGLSFTTCAYKQIVVGALPFNTLIPTTPTGPAQVLSRGLSNDYHYTDLSVLYPAGADYGVTDIQNYIGSEIPSIGSLRSWSSANPLSGAGVGHWVVSGTFTDAPGGSAQSISGILIVRANHINATSNLFLQQILITNFTGTGASEYDGTFVRTNTNNAGFSPWKVLSNNAIHPLTGISVTGSPFTYTNSKPSVKQVFVSGGTVSSVTITRGSTTVPTGVTAGAFILSPGDSINVTYTGTPTMNEGGS